jgi:hypothetical protein
MMLRRTLLLGLGLVGLSRVCGKPNSSLRSIPPSADGNDSLPPHCEALALVWKKQPDQIKELELRHANAEQKKQKEYVGADSRWWFDTDERRWTVARPFAPGGIDSTHWFTVTYIVGASEKLSWHVDTSKQEVTLMKE